MGGSTFMPNKAFELNWWDSGHGLQATGKYGSYQIVKTICGHQLYYCGEKLKWYSGRRGNNDCMRYAQKHYNKETK